MMVIPVTRRYKGKKEGRGKKKDFVWIGCIEWQGMDQGVCLVKHWVYPGSG
jgi:hypothetical protein